LSPPEFQAPVPTCIAIRGAACAMPRQVSADYRRPSTDVILEVVRRHQNATIFDPLPLVCDSTSCPGSYHGHPLLSDGNHLSPAAARALAGFVRPAFEWLVESDTASINSLGGKRSSGDFNTVIR
jgi:hypothetical protein